ncbi:hypothetical protein P7K49_014426 [Saguinus oedipus]|uniref:Uncharacterized protein n=1 Tax=Saguinus oedipus TaxID=9490 RepID=A0ABQ9VIR3_SAGOE|nr:hypothetical protein P7K49_014426 [Saguinus oedipus]
MVTSWLPGHAPEPPQAVKARGWVPGDTSRAGLRRTPKARGHASGEAAAPGVGTWDSLGLLELTRGSLLPSVPADQSPAGSGAYEDVAGGAQTGGLVNPRSLGLTDGGLELSPVDVAAVNLEDLEVGGLAFFMFTCLHTPQLLHETQSTLPLPGFNLRIGKPKGPRDPPAEWTRV